MTTTTAKHKPHWWPKNPYPQTVFPMPEERYADIVPEPELRTSLSGMLGRRFWNIASDMIWRAMQEAPIIVCLCGSTRFTKAFQEANLRETLDGKIVLSIGCDLRSDQAVFGHLPESDLHAIKTRLDELHLRKIDLADEVLILNVSGYIGESTQRELDYAKTQGKAVRFLEECH